MLIAARFVQGVGGALTSAVILGMIVTMFPEPREQAKAIGVYGFVASAGGSIGLLAGGALTEAINWHWIFFINIPVGIATAFLATRLVADRPGLGLKAGADLPGAVLLTGGLMLGVYTILQVGRAGLGLGPDARARRGVDRPAGRVRRAPGADRQPADAAAPLPLAQRLRARTSSSRCSSSGCSGCSSWARCTCSASSATTRCRSASPSCPPTVVMGTMSLRVSGPLDHALRPAKATLIASLFSIGLGLVLFSLTPVDATYVTEVMPATIFIGIGAGLGFPSLMMLAMSGATPSDSGLASGLINTSVQVGGAIGLAVLATLATERTSTLRADGESINAALNGGYHLAYLIGAGLVGVAIVAAATVLRSGSPAAVAHHAEPHTDRRRAEPAYPDAG